MARLIHQVEHVPEAAPSGTVVVSVDPHVNPDYMERIRDLESTIDRLRSTHRATDPVVLDARMQLAEITGESGDYARGDHAVPDAGRRVPGGSRPL